MRVSLQTQSPLCRVGKKPAPNVGGATIKDENSVRTHNHSKGGGEETKGQNREVWGKPAFVQRQASWRT